MAETNGHVTNGCSFSNPGDRYDDGLPEVIEGLAQIPADPPEKRKVCDKCWWVFSNLLTVIYLSNHNLM